MSETPISPLRARMIEDMSVGKFGEATQTLALTGIEARVLTGMDFLNC
jgi:hypothetical protein